MTHNQVAGTGRRAVDLFVQVTLTGLVRAEQAGRVPVRFTGTGPAIWRTFHNQLTDADLAVIALQDAGMAMPVPFAPTTWWPDWPDWALQHLAPGQVEAWLAQALTQADESPESFLQRQAQLLQLDLPTPNQLTTLPTPAAHERWLELPGTGGWVAFHLCTRDDATLYFWENFTVVCTTPEEMLLAGRMARRSALSPATGIALAQARNRTVGATDVCGKRGRRLRRFAAAHAAQSSDSLQT